MKKLVVFLMVSMLATSAFAVVDPDDDMLGIYFDMNADNNCLQIGGSIPFNAYLCLTNPTGPSVEAFEFSYVNAVPPGMEGMIFKLATILPAGAVDVGGGTALNGDHAVGLAAPVPSTPSTVLVTWQYMLLAVIPVEMSIGPFSIPSIPGADMPIIQVEGQLQTVGTSTGGPQIPVATVNLVDCVVGVEESTWGSVKGLYR